MKKTLYTVLFAAGIAAMSSCKSDIDNFMVDDTVGFLTPGLVNAEVFAGLDDPYDVYVLKSGKGFQAADVSISVDPEIITAYNEANEDNITVVPSDCYTITVDKLSLSKSDYKMPFVISWNRDKLGALLETSTNVGLPLRLTVSGQNVNIDEERLTTIIVPSLELPLISLEKPGRITGVMPTRRSSKEETVYMNIISNFIAKSDIDLTFSIDESLIEAYNEANGTKFKLLPAEAYDFDLEGWQIKKFLNNCLFHFTFKREALVPDEGISQFGEFMLPIRISKTSSANIDEESAYALYTVQVIAPSLDKYDMSIIECNNQIADDPDPATALGNFKPEYLLDGNTSTEWRSTWSNKPKPPYIFVIDLGRDSYLCRMGFENPVGNNSNYANSKSGYVETSPDNATWTRVGDWETGMKSDPVTEFDVETTRCRYVRFVVEDVFVPRTARNAIAELNFWGEPAFD